MWVWQTLLDGFSILSEKWPVVLGAVIVTGLGACLSVFRLRNPSTGRFIPNQKSLLLLAGFFGISLLLRLAFLTQVYVPPYFDSVEHYRIVKALTVGLETSTFPALTSSYYHVGFHFLAALLAFGLRANPIDVILVLGQVVLAAIPIPIFGLIRRETQSDLAAFFGMLLAGFGWYMPGFAVNWGKYPALAGLLALGIVLSLACPCFERGYRPRKQVVRTGWLLFSIFISTFFHTRTLIVILIAFLCWVIAGRIQILPRRFQLSLLGISLIGISILGKLIDTDPMLTLAFDPYLARPGLWITLTVIAMSPFALFKFPRAFYFSSLLILGVLIALFVPLDILLAGLENQTLLDRPFVELVMYLPLSLLGGLGLAGFRLSLRSFLSNSEKIALYISQLTAALLVGFAALFSISNYQFFPSDCCDLVKYDDTIAFDWIEKKLPPDARILIAASELNVLPAGPSKDLAGTDAGIWIPALTSRGISLAPFNTDFRATSTWRQLCQKRVGYIYVGGMEQSFNTAPLNEKAAWYDRILFLPKAQLFQLIGCSE